MVTRKEWAISKGLAKPGRGRLSLAAHEAIKAAEAEGMVFEDPRAAKRPAAKAPVAEIAKPVIEKPIRHIGHDLVGYTEQGWKVGFSTCRRCARHANFCQCDKLLAPTIVAKLDEGNPIGVELS